MSGLKLVLCGYERAGYAVLQHVLDRPDIAEVAVLTHEPPENDVDVRELAATRDLWWSTENVNDVRLPFRPDVIASVYYRYIVSDEVIASCDGRIFNAHPSLLPRHRGCSSVPWAIIEGDSVTGVTFHYIDSGIDTGPILLQAALQIRPDETQASLYERCMDSVARYWPAALELVRAGFPGVEQEGETCYHPRGAPNGGVIDEAWPPQTVERFIRAMTSSPLPPASFRGQPVRTLGDYHRLRDGPSEV